MIKQTSLLLIAGIILCSCSPATLTSAAESLNQMSSTSPKNTSLQCSGKTYGTFTSADAELSLNILINGEASGTFTNHGTIFQAKGSVPGRIKDGIYYIDSVNLSLDSRVNGGVSGVAGVTQVGLGGTYGSTGTLFGKINSIGMLEGTFKGVQGKYKLGLTCSR